METDTFATCFLAVALTLLLFYLIDHFADSAIVSALIVTLIALVAVVALGRGAKAFTGPRRRR